MTLEVIDEGEGIDPEVLPHIFERFRQGDSSTTRRHGGLGLGLSIVRHVVESHGGSVAAESEGRGRGATFRVRLPVRATASAVAAAGDGDDLLTQLRERKPVRALAVSAFGRGEERGRIAASGFAGYVQKPVEARALVRAVAGLFAA